MWDGADSLVWVVVSSLLDVGAGLRVCVNVTVLITAVTAVRV